MTIKILLSWIATAVLLAWVTNTPAYSGELGQIKRFAAPFPIQTYERSGNISDTMLTAENTPPSVGDISVDGVWPDNKMLLISFPTIDPDESYFIDYDAVEMVDPSKWIALLRNRGDLRCTGAKRPAAGSSGKRKITGTSAAPKGFTSPC